MIILAPMSKVPAGYRIDLQNARSLIDVFMALSSVFRGISYGRPENSASIPRNFEAFTEYVEDWIDTNWGQDLCVSIDGFVQLAKNMPVETLRIMNALHDAELNVIELKQQDPAWRAKWESLKIVLL